MPLTELFWKIFNSSLCLLYEHRKRILTLGYYTRMNQKVMHLFFYFFFLSQPLGNLRTILLQVTYFTYVALSFSNLVIRTIFPVLNKRVVIEFLAKRRLCFYGSPLSLEASLWRCGIVHQQWMGTLDKEVLKRQRKNCL